MKKFTIIIFAFLAVISCKNDDENSAEPAFGNLTVNFKNTINGNSVKLATDSYTNGSGEIYKIAELKYIVSNIVLINANGEEFKYPSEKSYFLINEEVAGSKNIALEDIPAGAYTKIRFGFGVEQSKYPFESGMANFIPTAEENGMLWNWAAGYKFLKYEGTYTTNTSSQEESFVIHVGSHGTNIDNYREMTLDLPNAIMITESTSPEVSINTDVAKIFDSTNTHSLEVKSDVQLTPEFSPKIAENISTMFSIITITN